MRNFRKLAGLAVVLAAVFSLRPASAQMVQVPGVGWEGQGADMVVLQLDPVGGTVSRPDMILMAYDNPPGGNSFRYRVGKNLNTSGVAASWSAPIVVTGVSWEGQGAGMAVASLDANTRPELILMAYDNPPGGNNFRYIVGWNLNANGVATAWSNHPQVPGLGWEGEGAAAVVGQIDANPRPDMIFVAYDAPFSTNSFRYRVGLNLDSAGNANWAAIPPYQTFAIGSYGQGTGAALVNLDNNPRPELVLMAVNHPDNPPGVNSFRYFVGWNLSPVGKATNWTFEQQVAGLGWEGQGAGLAVTCLDTNKRRDWIFMAYDNPPGGNSFRYVVLPNHTTFPTC